MYRTIVIVLYLWVSIYNIENKVYVMILGDETYVYSIVYLIFYGLWQLFLTSSKKKNHLTGILRIKYICIMIFRR